jgi:hypothetical protein
MRWLKEKTVIVVFTDRAEATKACDELYRAGFRHDQIDLVPPEGQSAPKQHEPGVKLKEKAGAALGGLVGALIGCLIGTLAATGAIPGIPSILDAAGLAAVVGALAGIIAGGLLGAVIGWAFEADEDSFFARELREGRTLMTVHGNGRSAEAAAILRRHQTSAVRASASEAAPHCPPT